MAVIIINLTVILEEMEKIVDIKIMVHISHLSYQYINEWQRYLA